ncbi:Type I Restriction modification protein [Bombilactobacillus mellifer]|uniref:Type I Restriction modification protein n=1 Tax=Bombilactobacillus mellifer TaxID=1218492 RepID=A0A0F4LWS0_9LACO|nr:restriction endonuclease subunit S [Bombilactobacillus mellifer]KJY62803.1 Type I Restriction modification protein [Bombilactobacillus mellifer]
MKYKNIKLGEAAEITMGQSPKSTYYNKKGMGIPFIQGVSTFEDNYPRIETYTTEYNKKAQKGDLLVSVRAPVGRINIANQTIAIGRGLADLKVKKGYSKSYIYYLFKKIGNQLDSISSGTVFSSINKKELSDLKIRIPEKLNDQCKIADRLRKLDEGIEINNQINDNLLELSKAMFHENSTMMMRFYYQTISCQKEVRIF